MSFTRRVLYTAKAYLFPVFCVACQQEGSWLCAGCIRALDVSPQLFCPLCHASTDTGEVCMRCTQISFSCLITRHIATVKYQEKESIGKLIHILKYEYAEDVMEAISVLLNIFVTEYTHIFPQVDMIVPVPLHTKRFVERGFNQASLISEALSTHIQIPVEQHILFRIRHTPHQAKLERTARLKNVKGAFHVDLPDRIRGMRVLLVDDVYTTGATMQACAKALHDAGASCIYGFTLARG